MQYWGMLTPMLHMQRTSSQPLSLMQAASIWPLETEEGELCFLSGLQFRM